jgi:hypothetical protein
MPARREGGRQGEGLIHSTGLQKLLFVPHFDESSATQVAGLSFLRVAVVRGEFRSEMGDPDGRRESKRGVGR